ncbi:MAG: DUF438 domain-containing protein, partial [Clostridiales bacterium]|nr:DUF438 domain-containing protein [Clostridiales bacterium]
MSKEINNREYRQGALREMIAQLHGGASVEEVKGRFEAVFGGVSAEEIAQAEGALIAGGLPVSEVQRLCDVHAAVFKGSIEEIHASSDPSSVPGHPLNTMKRENRAIEKLINEIRAGADVASGLERLGEIDRHYQIKENLFFPYMEKYGITAPPKVMWGVDDEIRAQLKAARANPTGEAAEALFTKIGDMIFKEENIMLPMLAENLTQDEWKKIADETPDLGYCLIDPPPKWAPAKPAEAPLDAAAPGAIRLPTGTLTIGELERMLNTLPFDITFVDRDDTVKYFSEAKERIFPRT